LRSKKVPTIESAGGASTDATTALERTKNEDKLIYPQPKNPAK